MKHVKYLLGAIVFLVLIAASPRLDRLTAPSGIYEVTGDSTQPLLPTDPYPYSFVVLPFHLIADTSFIYDPGNNDISDEGATLGRVLFYDQRLSANQTISCASCHVAENGFSDPAQFSEGFEGGLTERNSIGLANARFQPTGSFFWHAGTDTLQQQIKMALESTVEMGMDMDTMVARIQATSFYPALYNDAFGTPTITPERTFKAIGQFVRSMVSGNTAYDRGVMMIGIPEVPFPNFSAQENQGKDIFFNSAGCANCHSSHNFTTMEPMNNGLDLVYDDQGFATVTGQSSDNGKFKAPSLRNIALTAPYMHDGRFETLADVVDHYSNGVQSHPNLHSNLRVNGTGAPIQFNFSQSDKDALVAFLNTLTDNQFVTDPRWQNPFGLDSITPIGNPITISIDPIMDASDDLQVFPNPFTHQQRMSWTNLENTPAAIRIFNIKGQQVLQETVSGTQFILDQADMSPGIYLVEIRTAQRIFRKKIVKE